MADHDDLHAETTEGFKVGEKKTINEYHQLGRCRVHTLRHGELTFVNRPERRVPPQVEGVPWPQWWQHHLRPQ